MANVWFAGLSAALLGVGGSFPSVGAAPASGFVENRGQVDERISYHSLGGWATICFTKDAIVFDLHDPGGPSTSPVKPLDPISRDPIPEGNAPSRRGCAVYVSFRDANASSRITARGQMPTRWNYFLGNDPLNWRTNVPCYEEVVYEGVWPGVDLVFRGSEKGVRYVALLEPGADPRQVAFRYKGADSITEAGDGAVLLETPAGLLRHVQFGGGDLGGELILVSEGDTSPVCRDNVWALLWSTFLGGSYSEYGFDLALDPSGNPVVAGDVRSFDFPTTPGAYDESHNGVHDAFIAKLSSTGNVLLWATYMGGSADDSGNALVLDSSGNPLVIGHTRSSDFPATPGAYDGSYNGDYDAFVAELSADGNVLYWSTFLGGSGLDLGESLVLDPSGNPTVIGLVESTDFPTSPGAYDESHNGLFDAFVTKLSSSGSTLLWSTFLGGSEDDFGYALALDVSPEGVDPWGSPVVTGHTRSSGFPTTLEAYDQSHNGGLDLFVSKLSPSGSAVLWSTFLGGGYSERGFGLALDISRNPVVVGATYSSDFPTTPGAYDESYNGTQDAFAAKLSSDGRMLSWSTYLGGYDDDGATALTLDASGNPILTGWAASFDFPTTRGAYDESFNGGQFDVIISALSSSGSTLLWSTFLGGSAFDVGYSLALDPLGNPIVAGATGSTDFPIVPGAYDASYNGADHDVFITKMAQGPSSVVDRRERRQPILLATYPSPTRDRMTIRLDNPKTGVASVQIHDLGGRLVRRLFEGTLTLGRDELRWDGRDDSGRRLSPGVYFIRVRRDNSSTFGRSVMVQ